MDAQGYRNVWFPDNNHQDSNSNNMVTKLTGQTCSNEKLMWLSKLRHGPDKNLGLFFSKIREATTVTIAAMANEEHVSEADSVCSQWFGDYFSNMAAELGASPDDPRSVSIVVDELLKISNTKMLKGEHKRWFASNDAPFSAISRRHHLMFLVECNVVMGGPAHPTLPW